jgi:TrmH family RNA methyltransferase
MQLPVRIVLVGTSHPGNIGAAARAMKAMGLMELTLVRPKRFPSAVASARATGAVDILENARVVDTLVEAIADCDYVAGTSARLRTVQLPIVDPRECANAINERIGHERAAIVFGPERSGLTNDDLSRCRVLLNIPTVPGFSSLNLAMAVQIVGYELRMTIAPPIAPVEREVPAATAAELEHFHRHLEQVLTDAGFLHPEHQRQIKLKLRRIFHRAAPDQNELNILRGMLTALDPNKRGERRSVNPKETGR